MTHHYGRRKTELGEAYRYQRAASRSQCVGGWCVCAALALSLSGCAAMKQTVGEWFGGATATPTPTPATQPAAAPAAERRVYYAGVEGLKVYSEPSVSSKVVGTLTLYEKVVRTKLERGFAYVESATTGMKGWVNNGYLIWRLPSAAKPAAPAPEETPSEEPAAPAAEEPEEPGAAEAPPAAKEPAAPAAPEAPAPPPSAPPPSGAAPSIFNPY